MSRIIIDLITPNRYSRPQVKIKKIKALIIHWVGNPNSTAINNRNYFEGLKNQTKVYASAHEIIDLDGDVVVCIPKDEIAYHVGSKTYTKKSLDVFGNSPNYQTYGIECTHINWNGDMTKETQKSLVDRCVDLCIENDLNPLTDIWTHEEVVGWKDCHRYYSSNPKEWTKFKNIVNNQLKERMNPMYKDKDKISKWALPNVEKANELGLMLGDTEGNFNPKGIVTREMLATVIVNLYDKLNNK